MTVAAPADFNAYAEWLRAKTARRISKDDRKRGSVVAYAIVNGCRVVIGKFADRVAAMRAMGREADKADDAPTRAAPAK
jgi:hypothetical protein